MTLSMSYLITVNPGAILNELLSWLAYLNRGTVVLQLLLVGIVMVAEQRGALLRRSRRRIQRLVQRQLFRANDAFGALLLDLVHLAHAHLRDGLHALRVDHSRFIRTRFSQQFHLCRGLFCRQFARFHVFVDRAVFFIARHRDVSRRLHARVVRLRRFIRASRHFHHRPEHGRKH